MSEYTTVARPYAKAAFDFAVEQGALDKWHGMLAFATEVAQNAEVITFLNGASSLAHQSDVFIGICGEQLDSNGQNLIKVMASNERLKALPEVLRLFADMRQEYEKEVTVDVTSAMTLDDAQQAKLSAALEKRLERKVKLNCSVEPSIVGGLLIKAGDMVIDNTLRSQLKRLASSLQS
ncbi:F0F1 ATP synthase subunit delta [Aliidiomarina haloalkalitolerans]|uniref:ATP synthase subunit delta n=1 Tax=Aliidiomarina haloalkalitolerans TaxID=859059 RepID=A0A432VSC7_9GAMM|nr:F0F1 ATP synthase subunit delta [Aliidiomarina haloalkalitolerans]RUO19142.1 F0F1 ATP synthase subunit delta [Aliidiomarina haloalkalitolerans]